MVLLYLAAVFCLLQGLNALRIVHHWAQWEATFGSVLTAQAEIALYSKFWIALAIALCLIGYWAQRRLRRRSWHPPWGEAHALPSCIVIRIRSRGNWQCMEAL